MNKYLKDRVMELDEYIKEEEKSYNSNFKSKISKRAIYSVTIYNFELFLKELICGINNIDVEEYIYYDGTGFNSTKMKFNKKFKQLSFIDWDDETPHDIESNQFKARFVTRFLFSILNSSNTIVRNIYENTRDNNKKRYKKQVLILDILITRISNFVASYLSGIYEYHEYLMKVLELIILSNGDRKGAEVYKTLIERIDIISYMLDIHEDDDLTIYEICMLAYNVSANSLKEKKTPDFIENMTLKDKDDIEFTLSRLGYSILRRRMKDKSDPVFLYKIFQDSNPLYYSRYKNMNDDPEINVGVKSLEFLKFICDNKKLNNYVDKLVTN